MSVGRAIKILMRIFLGDHSQNSFLSLRQSLAPVLLGGLRDKNGTPHAGKDTFHLLHAYPALIEFATTALQFKPKRFDCLEDIFVFLSHHEVL